MQTNKNAVILYSILHVYATHVPPVGCKCAFPLLLHGDKGGGGTAVLYCTSP